MADHLKIKLTEPQAELVNSQEDETLFLGGYGSGKSEALVTDSILFALKYPRGFVAFYEPTYDLLREIAIARFEDLLQQWNIPYALNKSVPHIRFVHNDSRILFRSMDNPSRIIGYECHQSAVDEIDSVKNADEVVRRIQARNRARHPLINQNRIRYGTTPEGFYWSYDNFGKVLKPNHRLIRAPSYSNPYLPDDYITKLIDAYDEQRAKAYIEGQWVNLTSGNVYKSFDRFLHHTDEREKRDDVLHIGMDFNVTRMCAVVNVLRGGDPRAVGEIVNAYDTPDMIDIIRNTYPKQAARRKIVVYPDATAKRRDTRGGKGVSSSDISLLKSAGFIVKRRESNPLIKDRVASVEGLFSHNRYLINTNQCPWLTEKIEQQPYDKTGMPLKDGTEDILDGMGYYIHQSFPIRHSKSGPKPVSL